MSRTYVVQPGDSAASIAKAFTGKPAREKELVLYNRQKGYRVLANGNLYFTSLAPGEILIIPPTWGRIGSLGWAVNPSSTENGAYGAASINQLIRLQQMGLGQPGGSADDTQDPSNGPVTGPDASGDTGTDPGTSTPDTPGNTNQNLSPGSPDEGTAAVTTGQGTANSDGTITCWNGQVVQTGTDCPPNTGGVPTGPTPGPAPYVAPSGPSTPTGAPVGTTNWLLYGGLAAGALALIGGFWYVSKKPAVKAPAKEGALSNPHSSMELPEFLRAVTYILQNQYGFTYTDITNFRNATTSDGTSLVAALYESDYTPDAAASRINTLRSQGRI